MLKTYSGSCHCGLVTFEVDADIDHIRSCDCSICSKRGALIYRVENDCLRITTPLEKMSVYQWHTKTAKDYFCPKCGILPFRRPSKLTESELKSGMTSFEGWAINVRCLDGIDLSAIPIKEIYGSKI